VLHEGVWYIADDHGRPFADANGNRVGIYADAVQP
jgi:hypothetical protein